MQKLINQSEAANLIGVARGSIRYWERRKWLASVIPVAPIKGRAGKPAKLYRQTDVERVAKERGRTAR